MKRFFLTWLLALTAGAAAVASPMNDGHVLTALWKQYQEASKADRPQLEAEILAKIKQEAMQKHLPVDFYDAATEYVNTVLRRDWKQRDQLYSQLWQEVQDFNEPIVTFHWMNAWQRVSTDALWKYVQSNLEGFQGRNPAFYRDIQGYLGGTLKPFIANDKEYVLWRVLRDRYYINIESDEMYQNLLQEVAGKYPNEAALEYYVLGKQNTSEYQREERRKSLQAFAAKYAGKAVSVYPKAALLQMEKVDLDRQKADGTRYRALCDKAEALEKERKAYKGTEADIAAGCGSAASLAETLTDSNLRVSIQDGNILVVFQNLKQASLTLRGDKKTVKTWKAVNPIGSFYVQDTLTIPMPKLPDGDYTAEAVSGKLSDLDSYSQYTLSIATRTDSRGPSVYVADYESGAPLGSATILLKKGDKEISRTTMKLDGFTLLPEAFLKDLERNKTSYCYLEAQNGDRRSRQVEGRAKFNEGYKINYDYARCNIYKDQGAYNPGDVVRFKAVVFQGDPSVELNAIAGREVEMRLRDSEDNILESVKLTTNEFGAVSGSFQLPAGLRNGWFTLEAVGLESDRFRVDEFVLPTYELSFDPIEKLYMVGNDIPVDGKLMSYSGHSLSGAKARIKVVCYSRVILEEEQAIGEDNRFHFLFPAREQGYYQAEVTVTDATGETRSFSQGYYVGESLQVGVSVLNAARAELTSADAEKADPYRRLSIPRYTLLSTGVRLNLQARDAGGNDVPLPVRYRVELPDESIIASGETASGQEVNLTLPGMGFYRLVAEVSAIKPDGKETHSAKTVQLYCLPEDSDKLMPQASRVFIPGPLTVAPDAPITARVGTSRGVAYAQALLYADKGTLLESRKLNVADGTLSRLSFDYKASYPDAVRLMVFYFIHGKAVCYDWEYRREKDRYSMPLQYTRFQDKAYPGTQYSFTLKTAPGTEVLVAAWDKSLDAIEYNHWSLVNTRDFSVDRNYVSSVCGSVGTREEMPVRAYGRALAKGAGVQENMALAAPVMREAEVADDEGVLMEDNAQAAPAAEIKVRSDFASALTFQPHLRPAADGTLTFSFSTADKLSTYYVRAYAHDSKMRNAMVEQEMVVSLPVKVALVEPRFLYAGDVYDAAVTVSSNVDVPVSGVMGLWAGEAMQELPVTVMPHQTVTRRFRVSASGEGDCVFKAFFRADDFSDAVQVSVPVYPAAQVLTEAHSAVLRAGMDREALLKELRARFVNIPASEVTLQEISILDMVKDAIPSHVEPSGKDVLSISEAWYIGLMASRLGMSVALDDSLLEKILACQNGDGGFAWFEGMSSSQAITAVMLERFAKLRDRGFQVPDVTSAVEFLDEQQFEDERSWWGGISDAQYLHIRSLYADVPFRVKAVSITGKKRMNDFQKWAKDYLTPSKKDGRGLKGQILNKGRRLLTLRNLTERSGGVSLAKAWGVGLGASAKLEKSLKADVASLVEYAVEHRDGGRYYPNAVMPWRGLMESEAYAHALLCDLLQPYDASLADGIRLWLMLQKETQHWDTEPAYIDAITSILDGSQAVLDTRVLALSGTYKAPFAQVKASGNGFKIERRFFKEVTRERKYDDKTGPNDYVSVLHEIQPGDPVSVGDKILVRYLIWNAENRSFVKLVAGREASLQPVQQLSGHLGYSFFTLRPGFYSWSYYPQGYRNVKASCTEYYFESYPEENTELAEEFFVQQAGTFQAPVVVIESLYAPHYRANTAFRPALSVKPE